MSGELFHLAAHYSGPGRIAVGGGALRADCEAAARIPFAGPIWRKRLTKERPDRFAFGQQIVGAALFVGGFQVVDAHRMVDRLGDVGGR